MRIFQADPQLTSQIFRMKGWHPELSDWSKTLQILGIKLPATIYQPKKFQVCLFHVHVDDIYTHIYIYIYICSYMHTILLGDYPVVFKHEATDGRS